MLRKFSALLVIALSLVIPSFAYELISYPAQYWIVGTVNDSVDGLEPGKAEGKTVTLHTQNNPDEDIATAVVSGNQYKINALEKYFISTDNSVSPATYQVSIINNDGAAGYGAGAQAVTLSGIGWDTGPALNLQKGAGIPVPLPAGTIPFTSISRIATDIKLTWDVANHSEYKNPKIFMLPGNGTGQFTNLYDPAADPKWIQVTDGAGKVLPDLTTFFDYTTDGVLIHKNQVGTGNNEVYYKAVQNTVLDVTADPGKSTLQSAYAVGKVNLSLFKTSNALTDPGKNYISVPFIQNVNNINNALDVQQFEVGTKVYSQLQGKHYNFDIAKVASINGQKFWVSGFDASQKVGDTFAFVPEKGYMLEVPNDNLVTTFGNVPAGTEGRTRTMDANDYTFIGNFYPNQFSLSDPNVNTSLKLAASAQPNEGDSIYYQLKPGTKYNFDMAAFKSGKWTSGFDKSGNTPTNITLGLPYGYMYQRKGDVFIWTR